MVLLMAMVMRMIMSLMNTLQLPSLWKRTTEHLSQIVEVQWDYDDDDEYGDDYDCDVEDCHVNDGNVDHDIEDGHPKIMIFMMIILMEADNHKLVSDCGSTTGLGWWQWGWLSSDDANDYDYDDDKVDDIWQPHTCLRLWEYNVQWDHMLPISDHLTACHQNEEFEMGRNVSQ